MERLFKIHTKTDFLSRVFTEDLKYCLTLVAIKWQTPFVPSDCSPIYLYTRMHLYALYSATLCRSST